MKKTFSFLFPLLLLITVMEGCKKNTSYTTPAALMMVNAVVNSELILTDFGMDFKIRDFYEAKTLRYNEHLPYNYLSLPPGKTDLTIYNYPDTTAHDSPLKSFSFDVKDSETYTLFMVGTKTNPDSMLIKEELPAYELYDSTFSVRFLSLSPDAGAVDVEVDGKIVATDISFKERASWIRFSAKVAAPSYEVNFRDKATSTVLASYTIINPGTIDNSDGPNVWRRNNYTMALIGSVSETGAYALKVLPVRHVFPG